MAIFMIPIVWLLFGVITAVAASNKGRSGCGWLLVGILLGPFGFVLSLVVSKDESSVEKEVLASGTLKKCPCCAELIKPEAITCRYCGKDLNTTENPQDSAPSHNGPLLDAHGNILGGFAPSLDETSPSDTLKMEEYGITFDGKCYAYGEYKFDSLSDAIRFAKP